MTLQDNTLLVENIGLIFYYCVSISVFK